MARFLLETSATDGFLLEDGSGVLLMEDLPTLTVGGQERLSDPVVYWNPRDCDSDITLSGGFLTATGDNNTSACVRATVSKSTGKWLYAVNPGQVSSTLTRPGFSNALHALTTGIASGGTNTINWVNTTGNVCIGTSTIGTAATWTAAASELLFAIDLDNMRIWVAVDGGNWNNSGSADPATNTGGFDISGATLSTGFFPTFGSISTGDNVTANFGASAFTKATPSGFSSWGGDGAGWDTAAITATAYSPERVTQAFASALTRPSGPPPVRATQVFSQALITLGIPDVRATQAFTQALVTYTKPTATIAGVETGADTASIEVEVDETPPAPSSTSSGGGWLPPTLVKRSSRLERERAEEEELERRAREGYARAHGEAQEAPEAPGSVATVATVASPPPATPEPLADPSSLDWAALHAELAALRHQAEGAERMAALRRELAILAELQRLEDEDEEDLLLLIAG